MASIIEQCSAKSIFTKSFVAVFKDSGVTSPEINNWIKLSLYFEDPTKTLTRGMLYSQCIPQYSSIFQTGALIFSFGLRTFETRALRKYWKHEWILTAVLGRQTVDHYSSSPLIKYHDHSFIDENLLKKSFTKFIGTIEQTLPGPLFDHSNKSFGQLDNNTINTTNIQSNKSNVRLKQCYSIDLLEKNDRQIKLRILCDGLFDCRAFVRDLSNEIACKSSLESLHLAKLGPIEDRQCLKKHELHYEQLVQSANEVTPICVDYLKKLREQYPEAKSNYRYI